MIGREQGPLSGRRAEAARNDGRILDAARAVFAADPEAPIAVVAARAGVGIGALYRRYPSKEVLLHTLAAEGLAHHRALLDAALADEGEPWAVFAGFLRAAVAAGSGSLTVRFAGEFPAGDALHEAGRAALAATQRLLDRAQGAGVVRADLTVGDLALLLEQAQALRLGDDTRAAELRQRVLTIVLDGLRAPDASPLPGAAPTWAELRGRYDR